MPGRRPRPQRTCLGCRQVHDQVGLVRYVLAPDGSVQVDYREKLPGRGAYTCLTRECIRLAVTRKQFDRAFRTASRPVSADELCERLVREMQMRLDALLGMARKSSQILSGGNQVLEALDRPDNLAAVILAGDISAGVSEKIVRKARGHGIPCLNYSTKLGLGEILGRSERSVTALLKGHLAEVFLAEWQKLMEISGDN